MKKLTITIAFLSALLGACAAQTADDADAPTPPDPPASWRLVLEHEGSIRGDCPDAEASLTWDVVDLDTDAPTIAQVEALGGTADCAPLAWEQQFGQWRLTCAVEGAADWQVVVPLDPSHGGDAAWRTRGDCIDQYDATVIE